MFIAKIENGIATEFPITEKELRIRLGNTSLPALLTTEALEPLGYVVVPASGIENFPTATKDLEVFIESVVKEGNFWKRNYGLRPVTGELREIRLRKKWKEVRTKRDELLSNSDWRVSRYNREVALGKTPTDNINMLHTYMQALADITDQEDPFLIQYPVYGEN